jgi:hypothetical protein
MNVTDTSGLLVVNNRVAAGLTNKILSCSKLKIRDNATHRVVGDGAYTANDKDFYIGIKATSATKITLPPASERAGSELMIMKEVGTTNTVSVVPQQRREKVKGVDIFNLNAPYSYVMIVSDGTNWVER